MADITPTAVELLAQARTQLAWRSMFLDEPEYQEQRIREQARGLAIYHHSDIGRRAVAIGVALNALIAEVEGFLRLYPGDGAAIEATRDAIIGAGLSDEKEPWATCFRSSHFACTVEELATWRPMLQMMRERIECCEPLDVAMSADEWDSRGRIAA